MSVIKKAVFKIGDSLFFSVDNLRERILHTRPFYNGLTGFDKEEFKRFRRSHPTLTNQEAMSMFKLNYGHSRHIGMSHGL